MLDLYNVYRILSSVNMLLFVISFLIFMNKRGYYLKLGKDFRSIVSYIVTAITIIFIGLPFGMVRFQILATIIIMLNLICRFIYDLDARNTIIISFIYSFLYILLESSIYVTKIQCLYYMFNGLNNKFYDYFYRCMFL